MGGALRVCIACDTFGFMERLHGNSTSNCNCTCNCNCNCNCKFDILTSYANLSPDIA